MLSRPLCSLFSLKSNDKGCPVFVWFCTFAVFFSGCRTAIPEISVRGMMMGEAIQTTVDSEIARYYLENYLQNQDRDEALDKKIDAFYRQYQNRTLNRDDLKKISAETSTDFAGLFWAEHLYQNKKNSALQEKFHKNLSALRATSPAQAVIANAGCCMLLFVPGWDYVASGPFTGADLARPMRITAALGIESLFIPLNPHGGVEENADLIRRVVQEQAAQEKAIILVGPSSAGPAIHLGLTQKHPPEARQAVKAWINLAGILQGTPLVDHYQTWPRSWLLQLALWWKGWEKDKVLSMSMKSSRARFKQLTLPKDLIVINYIGLALSGDITALAAENYAMLRKKGPNDGLTLLPDSIAPGSRTIVALNSDHFFNEDPEIELKTIALTQVLFELLASQSK